MRDRGFACAGFVLVAALLGLPPVSIAHQSSTPRTGTASTSPAAAADAIVGTWKLASWVRQMSDGRVLPYDPVVGILFYDRLGNMSVQINATDPSNATRAAPAAPGQETAQNYTAYFGTYSLDLAKRTVTHHIRGNRSGSAGRDAVRQFELEGDTLTLRAPGEGFTHLLVWQRAK